MVVMAAGKAGWWSVAIESQVDKGLNSTDGYIDTNIDTTANKPAWRFPAR